jgi:uncharacterized SAM-binding protein YcdF (DUF218 family)
MFLFKKIVGGLLSPLSLCLALLCLGLALLWATRRQKAGKILVTLGTCLLALLSYPYFPEMLLRPLERKYSPVRNPAAITSQAPAGHLVKWIVVLDGIMQRTVEGIRLYKELPGTKLILSGGPVFGLPAGSEEMARVGLTMGVNPRDMILESQSRDTEDEARLIQKLVGQDKFILVTSASHLPRAMTIFRQHGMDPIPAPTDYLVQESPGLHPGLLLPNARTLWMAEIAVHEYLGLAWIWLRGAI